LPKHIYFCNSKGGCGKTMLATQTAAYFAVNGHSVALADHDRQRSALDWLRQRPSDCAAITPVAAYRKEDAPEAMDVIVHDLPGSVEIEQLHDVSSDGGHLLLPLLPSPTDLMAGVRFLMALNAENWVEERLKVGIVANRVRHNTRYHEVLMSFLEKINRPLVGALRDTQNYIRASQAGVSVFDLAPSRVRRDLEQWQPILDWLTIPA